MGRQSLTTTSGRVEEATVALGSQEWLARAVATVAAAINFTVAGAWWWQTEACGG